MKCPICKGRGEYSFPEATSVDMSDGWYECEHCGGTGEVPDDPEEEKRLREKRKRNEALNR